MTSQSHAPEPHTPEISVVVPVLHDTPALAKLLATARDARDEWLVVNGDPADTSLGPLRAAHQDVTWLESRPGRGTQLGVGAARARGRWVLLLHADTHLAGDWRREVTQAASAASKAWGCFRLRIDTPAWQARLIELVVRGRVRLFRLPYGDQALFVRRETLKAVGGVPAHPLMEDVALARRLGRLGPPFRSPVSAVTSARRWEREGWWRRTARNWGLLTKYLLGVPPALLAREYRPEGTGQPAPPAGTDPC
jgi:rSAM/selenodomain-associated transferase 2